MSTSPQYNPTNLPDIDLSLSLQYPPSPTASSPTDSISSSASLPSYGSPYSAYVADLPSSFTPPPFYPEDNPPPYERNLGRPETTVKTNVNRVTISHPYSRLYAKKETTGKRRRIWNHALEKSLFNPYELSTLGAPHRRTIYTASLEAHVDRLHAQLLSIGFWPVAFDELEPFKGLNSKTAKSMVAGLQHDVGRDKLKLLELERANDNLRKALAGPQVVQTGAVVTRRASVDSLPDPDTYY